MAVDRIGVLVETGDPTTAGVLPFECLQGWLRDEPDLLVLGAESWSTTESIQATQQACLDHELTRLVVCGPSPESSQLPDWLAGTTPGQGIPIFYAAVREQAAWTVKDTTRAATKAKRLIEVAISRARSAQPIYLAAVAACRRVAVVGGGLAAHRAAEALSQAGLSVALLLDTAPSGCHFPQDPALAEAIENHPRVETIRDAHLVSLKGGVGAFRLHIQSQGSYQRIEAGAVVVAADAQAKAPELEPALADSGRVTSLREFGAELAAGQGPKDGVCIWLDAGERDRRCVDQAAVQFARQHAERGGKAIVLARQMPAYGTQGERQYDEARAAGVRFLRQGQTPPEIEVTDSCLSLRLVDTVLPDRLIGLQVDRLVLPERVDTARICADLSKALHQATDQQGLLQSGNVRHRPVASAQRGVFFVGGCHDECDPTQAALEAQATAAQIPVLLPEQPVAIPADQIAYDTGHCARCLNCVRACPHGAIRLSQAGHWMEVDDAACWQCGICAAVCPGLALEHGAIPFVQMRSALTVATRDLGKAPPVIAFACRQGAIRAADNAARTGLGLPDDLLLIDVPCAGLVSDRLLLNAFEQGARGVIVLGCHEDNCRSLWGADLTRKRVELLHDQLEKLGVSGDRIRFHAVAANESFRLVHLLSQAVLDMPAARAIDPATETASQEALHA